MNVELAEVRHFQLISSEKMMLDIKMTENIKLR